MITHVSASGETESILAREAEYYGIWNDGGWVTDNRGIPYYGPRVVMKALRHNILLDLGCHPATTTFYEVRRMTE